VTELPERWWRDSKLIQEQVAKHGDLGAAARANGVSPSAVRKGWADLGLPARPSGRKAQGASTLEDAWLLRLLKRHGDDASVDVLADAADVSPRRVREALERLQAGGYRVNVSDEKVTLARVAPQGVNLHKLSPKLFDGELLRVGVVSDTHLGANEEALAELHLAYDIFQREGISEVWHAGDWGTGVGMFRTHHAEAHVHTAAEQVDYLAEHYPARKGIVTRGISGNHDLEGDFGRIGFDPVAALANRRSDVDYLGEYGAWLELREGTGSWVHLLHGAGGMSYAYSYKAQKIVDGYPAGRKPAVTIVGHWHVRGNFQARNVELVFPGCFEWQSRFMQRLGLQPAVGFHILELRVAADGSVVEFTPRWFPYYAGRVVEAKAA
jgi:predicted phosphodiesterase